MTQTRRSIPPARRGLLRFWSASACAALLFAASAPASAAGGDSAIRISADAPIGGFTHTWYPPRTIPSSTVGFFGLTAAPLQLGVGYLFRKNIYLGGRFGIQGLFPDGRDAIFEGRLTGRFEYVFNGTTVRPFV